MKEVGSSPAREIETSLADPEPPSICPYSHQMSTLPGAFNASDTEEGSEIDMQDFARVVAGQATDSEDHSTEDDDEDLDFELGEEDEDDVELDEDALAFLEEQEGDEEDEEDENDESGGNTATGADNAGQLRIGYDREYPLSISIRVETTRGAEISESASTGAILLIDSEGNPRRLTSQDLRGTTMSLASIRNMLLNRFGRTNARGGEDEEDEDEDPDFLDDFEDEDDDDGAYS